MSKTVKPSELDPAALSNFDRNYQGAIVRIAESKQPVIVQALDRDKVICSSSKGNYFSTKEFTHVDIPTGWVEYISPVGVKHALYLTKAPARSVQRGLKSANAVLVSPTHDAYAWRFDWEMIDWFFGPPVDRAVTSVSSHALSNSLAVIKENEYLWKVTNLTQEIGFFTYDDKKYRATTPHRKSAVSRIQELINVHCK